MDLIREIQDIAQDFNRPLESCLLKCMVLANELKVQPLMDWATAEEEGYERIEDVPAYRRISPARSLAHVTNGVRYEQQVISKLAFPAERWKELEELAITDSVSSIELLAQKDSLVSVWPDHLKHELSQNFRRSSGYWVLDAWFELPPAAFRGVLSSVRSRLLRFSFKLQVDQGSSDEPHEEVVELSSERVASVFSEVILGSAASASQWEEQ